MVLSSGVGKKEDRESHFNQVQQGGKWKKDGLLWSTRPSQNQWSWGVQFYSLDLLLRFITDKVPVYSAVLKGGWYK